MRTVTVDVGVLRHHNLVLQAVVTLGPRIDEGELIEAVAPAWFKIARAIQRDPTFMHQIGDRKLEELIAAAYTQAGFDEVTLTSRSGDFGRDVIAVKRGFFTVRILDQVKAYGPGHRVPAAEVRELGFVLLRDNAATHGIVTTTSDFAPRIEQDPYIQPLLNSRLKLVNGKKLVEWLEALLTGYKISL